MLNFIYSSTIFFPLILNLLSLVVKNYGGKGPIYILKGFIKKIMKESYLNSYNQKRRSQSNAVKLPYIERRKREKSFQTDNKSFEIQPLNKKRNDSDK